MRPESTHKNARAEKLPAPKYVYQNPGAFSVVE